MSDGQKYRHQKQIESNAVGKHQTGGIKAIQKAKERDLTRQGCAEGRENRPCMPCRSFAVPPLAHSDPQKHSYAPQARQQSCKECVGQQGALPAQQTCPTHQRRYGIAAARRNIGTGRHVRIAHPAREYRQQKTEKHRWQCYIKQQRRVHQRDGDIACYRSCRVDTGQGKTPPQNRQRQLTNPDQKQQAMGRGEETHGLHQRP